LAASLLALWPAWQYQAQSTPTTQPSALALPVPPADQSAARLAQDEAFWRDVATHYRRIEGIIDLEHGYWGKMAAPVEEAYLAATRKVNQEMAVYARGEYGADLRESTARVACSAGCGG
jgi:isopenicillin-N epimerase